MISGTSHDGIDVAVCDFRTDGEHLVGSVEHVDSVPYAGELRRALVAALPPEATSVHDLTRLDTLIGQAFAGAAVDALAAHRRRGLGPVDAVCSHGQTVYHWVEGGVVRGTLQLGQPAWLAEATGLTVVSDLRAADVAAGGQGAPLVSVLDQLVLGPLARDEAVAALNLGGISNLTVCAPGTPARAWDIGPANALVDAVVSTDQGVGRSFDEDGRLALAGTVVPGLLEVLLDEPYYRQPPPKSTGKELFHVAYVRSALRRWGGSVRLEDLVATLVELTARTVAEALRTAGVTRVFASGGGVRNPALMRAVAAAAPEVEVSTTRELGLDPDAKEAVAFALIGWSTLHGIPASVPSCTGAHGARVLGRVTAGPASGVLPTAGHRAPTSLAVRDDVVR